MLYFAYVIAPCTNSAKISGKDTEILTEIKKKHL